MGLSIIGIFGAGLLTFISPCVLPMVPIIAANYLMAGNESRFARVKSTLFFSAGFLLTFTLMGISLPVISGFLGSAKYLLLSASAIFIFLYGLKMSGLAFKSKGNSALFSWMNRSAFLPDFQKHLPKSLHGFLFGATFGLAWTPCVGPILGGVLTYVATKDRSVVESVILMLSFALGIVLPFIALAVGGDLLQKHLHKIKRNLPAIEEFTGYALIAVSVMIFMQIRPAAFMDANKQDESQISFVTMGARTTLNDYAPGANKLLFFHTSTCPICKQMETFMPTLEKECNSKDFKIIRINVELPGNQDIADRFNIKAVPTMSLITADGKEISHTVGYQSEMNLRRAIGLFPTKTCENLTAIPREENSTKLIPEGKTCNKSENGQAC